VNQRPKGTSSWRTTLTPVRTRLAGLVLMNVPRDAIGILLLLHRMHFTVITQDMNYFQVSVIIS